MVLQAAGLEYNFLMRIIGHLDMDAFFAAVEERDRKWLRGKPVIVGADPRGGSGRGVVSTANYKAREYGIHSAMAISRAWMLCEDAKKKGGTQCVFLSGNFRKYGEVSGRIMEILGNYSSLVEQASIDEAYFEIAGESWEEARNIARKIKKEILKKEKLTGSIGIGPNKLIAKIASDYQKPDGLTLVRKENAEKFLEPLLIRKIPGIGPKTEVRLVKKGIKTVLDLKKLSREEIGHIYDRIRGKDDSPIVLEYETKSIGEENTFEEDTRDPNVLVGCLNSLVSDVFERFKKSGLDSFRTAVLKIRFSNFETKTRSHTLSSPAASVEILRKEAMKLLMPFLDSRENPQKKAFRLLGLRIEKLYNK